MIFKNYVWDNSDFTNAHSYLIDNILSNLPDKNSLILDFGCGNGAIANYLISKGYNVYGIDPSENGISIANLKNPGRFYKFDIQKYNLPIELQNFNFDFIISTEVIEHVYNPRDYIFFCKKILKKNGFGKVLITTPYHGYFKNLIISLFGLMDNHFTVLWDGGHIKFWSKKTLNIIFSEFGFKKIKFKGCGRYPFLWKSMLLIYEI